MQRIAGNRAVVRSGTASVHVARQHGLSPHIPDELKISPNVRGMTDVDLRLRYDLIVSTLSRFDVSTPETADLDRQLWLISTELSRRTALALGRTFPQRTVDAMKQYLIGNAKTERDSCIVCMNKGIRKLLEDPSQKVTSESVEKTMEMLRQSGRASAPRVIGFKDSRGRVTRGGGRPHALDGSAGAVLLEMVGTDVGWSVFGMSLMDGYHSVTVTVDTSHPGEPKIYWSDQWKSKKGWKEYSRAELDKEIVSLIQGWWDDQDEGKKHTLVVRLWRLQQ